MSAPLRSKQGCWTCRLRKKKCDEGRPYCSTCSSLSITCYGFGPKPEFMDNGEEERAVVDRLKQIVKRTSRRKAATEPSKQLDSIIKIAPKSAHASMEKSSPDTHSSSQLNVGSSTNNGPSQENTFPALQNGSAVRMAISQQA